VLGYLRARLTPRRHADAPSSHLLPYATLPQAIASGARAARVLGWLPTLLILIVALLPRVAQLSDSYTTDEAYFWQGRVWATGRRRTRPATPA
jgi:hypothetical protein